MTTILRIAKLLRPDEKLRLLLLALLRSSVSVIDLLAISILAIAVSVGTGGGIPSALSSLSPDLSSLGITTLIIASACLFLSKTLFGLILARVSALYLAHLESLHSDRIARRIFSGGLRFFRDFSRQEIEWGVLRSTENLLSGFVGQFLQFLSEFALAIAIISLFFATDSSAAFFVLGYLGLFAVLFHLLTSKRIRRAGETFANHSLKFMNILNDMISAFREIVVLSVGEEYLARLHGARRDVAFARASEQFLSAIPRLVIETGLILGALFFAAIELGRSTGSPDYGSVTVFLAGSLRMMSAVLPLQRSISAMIFLKGPSETALGFIERSERSIPPMEFQPVDVDNRKSIDELRQPVGVRVSKVSFNYSVGHPPVLTDISLEIKPGTLVGLVGPSGAGKSTLADLLIGIQKPQVGTVRLNGIESSEFRASFPGLLGYVPQKPGIVSGSIMSNVALGVPENKIDLERVRTALEKADILSVVMSLRGQFQADIGKHHDSLSGGQLQRLGIARALYSSPSLLVLDEATSALDAETEASISHTLLKLRKSCTVVVIAHRLSTIQNADNIFMLESGRLSGEGNFLELRTKNARFREFIRLSEVGRNENGITA